MAFFAFFLDYVKLCSSYVLAFVKKVTLECKNVDKTERVIAAAK